MIKFTPVSFVSMPENQNSDKTKDRKDKKREKKYNDPLMQWPARGLAYTNELGAALSEVAPKLGILLWFPAMLYFGADIYDKYKNEKTSFDPNAQRGTEQAIFQLLASVILPTAAVITGQKTASLMGLAGKSGLSLQSQEETINFVREFESRRHIDNYTENMSRYKEHFKKSLTTKHEKLIRENKIKNPLVLLIENIWSKKQPSSMAMSKQEKVLAFADKHIDKAFNIYKTLRRNQRPKEFSDKMWKKFQILRTKYQMDPDYKNTFERDAAEDIIRKFQKNQMTNSKILKTIGGFVALGLAIKPIDSFVENVVIKKVVNPNLNTLFNSGGVKEYKEKHLGK